MVDDLFTRALQNKDNITNEELQLNNSTDPNGTTAESNLQEVKNQDIVDNIVQVEDTKDDDVKTADSQHADSDSSDSDSSVDSDSDSDSSDGEIENSADEVQHDEDENEDEDEGPVSTDPIRSKHEVVEENIVEIPKDYKIDPQTNIQEIGKIKSIFQNNVIIEGAVSGEKRVLREGSIFCLENRSVIGKLLEVFGQLQRPFYRIGLPTKMDDENDLVARIKQNINSKCFIVLPDAHWIDTFELKRIKGTDASNGYDEELPEEEQEFSDDEKEAQFKKMKKDQKNKNKKKNSTNNSNSNNQNISTINNGGRINKRKQPSQPFENKYNKMKVPAGMVTENHYKSRSARENYPSNDERQNHPHQQSNNNTDNNNRHDYYNNSKNNNQNMQYNYPNNGNFQNMNNNFMQQQQHQQFNYGMNYQNNHASPPHISMPMPVPIPIPMPFQPNYNHPYGNNTNMHNIPSPMNQGIYSPPPPPPPHNINNQYMNQQYPPQPSYNSGNIPSAQFQQNQPNMDQVHQLHQILLNQRSQQQSTPPPPSNDNETNKNNNSDTNNSNVIPY